jgi:hypothetical protein
MPACRQPSASTPTGRRPSGCGADPTSSSPTPPTSARPLAAAVRARPPPRRPRGDRPRPGGRPELPTPVGPGHKLVSRAKRALVWVVVVPDVPSVEFGPGSGPVFGGQASVSRWRASCRRGRAT